MNVMRRFTLRSLLQNKKRTAVTIIGVILSVAMITAVAALSASFISLFQRDAIATGGSWHAQITGINAADAPAVLQSGIVADCTFGRDVGYTKVNDEEEKFYFLRQYTKEGYQQMSIRLLSGRLPQNSREVAISRRILVIEDIKAGDTISLQSGMRLDASGLPLAENPALQQEGDGNGNLKITETFVPGVSNTYTVVGVIDQPTFEQSWSAGYGVLGYLDLSELNPEDKVDVWFTVPKVSQDIEENAKSLAASIGKTESDIRYNSGLLRYYGVMGSDRQSRFVYSMMIVMIGVIVVASVCLIYNAFAISVAERARQLGLLSSVGATLSQKCSSIYFEGLVISLIGIPLGLAAGAGGIAVTMHFLRPLLRAVLYVESDAELVMQLPWWAIGVTVLFSLVTIFLSVYIPARRASKITPMEAIRLSNEVKLTDRTVKTSRLTRKLFGFEAEIALKNLKRSKKKYRATVVSLVISLALFLTVSQYISLLGVTAGAMDEGYNYDISLDYYQVSDTAMQAANREIAKLAEAKEVVFADKLWGLADIDKNRFTDQARQVLEGSLLEAAGIRAKFAKPAPSTENVEVNSYSISLTFMALDQTSFEAYAQKVKVDAAPYMDAGNPKGILINYGVERLQLEDGSEKKVAGQIFNLTPGEVLSSSVMTRKTKEDGTPVNITIGALTTERPLGVTTPSFSYTIMVVSQPVLSAIKAEIQEPDGLQLMQHSVYLTANRDDLTLEKQLNGVMESNNVLDSYIFNVHSEARTERNRNMFLGVLIYGFITLITLICIANIFNTVSTNIALRRKEFAMLRSVGMTPGSFRKMIRYESIFYGLKGLMYGLPLSLLMAYLLYRINRTVMDFAFTLPWVNYAVAVLMILAIVLATMLYASAKVRKENIIEALKEENM
jgi:putative ABC transport system permease protein